MFSRGLRASLRWMMTPPQVTTRSNNTVPIMLNRFYCNQKPPRMPDSKERSIGRVRFTWKSLRSSSIILAIMGGTYFIIKNKKDKEIAKARQRSVGKAAIGGDFELVDHTGKTVTNKDFHGNWIMLYFGFTHCPDICPDEMEKMALVKDQLASKAQSDRIIDGKIVPLFISVDPARDGVKEVAEYIKEFHPEMIGLTGTMEAITKAAKTFRVYFSAGPAEYENDYIVDHTIIIYLINPDGEFVDYYGQRKNAEQITESIKKHMYKYQRLHAPSLIDQITDFIFGPSDDDD